MENLLIYAVSDSIGETAQQVSRAAISQFGLSEDEYDIRRHPFVNTEDRTPRKHCTGSRPG